MLPVYVYTTPVIGSFIVQLVDGSLWCCALHDYGWRDRVRWDGPVDELVVVSAHAAAFILGRLGAPLRFAGAVAQPDSAA